MTVHPHNGPVVSVMPFDDDLRFGRAPGVTRDLPTGPVTDIDFVCCGSRPEERDGVRLGPEAGSVREAA
ncbi:hypothetical protein [Streptomyces sp. WG7]|uniref:hypothetical protein n=1 Tax=Streptomyces sp. WG7 TaxID=3417650 RepID=UPI003CEFDDB7